MLGIFEYEIRIQHLSEILCLDPDFVLAFLGAQLPVLNADSSAARDDRLY